MSSKHVLSSLSDDNRRANTNGKPAGVLLAHKDKAPVPKYEDLPDKVKAAIHSNSLRPVRNDHGARMVYNEIRAPAE